MLETQFEPEDYWQDSFLLWEVSLCPVKAFSCLDEAHSHYGGLSYLNFIDLNVNFIQNTTFIETSE